jgi:hypothetical protein
VTEDHRAREATRATVTEDRRVREATRATVTEDRRAREATRATVMEDHRDNVQAEMQVLRQVPLILQSRQSLPATGLQRTLIKMADLIREIKMTRLRKEHRAKAESRIRFSLRCM